MESKLTIEIETVDPIEQYPEINIKESEPLGSFSLNSLMPNQLNSASKNSGTMTPELSGANPEDRKESKMIKKYLNFLNKIYFSQLYYC